MIDPRMQQFLEAQRRGSLIIGLLSSIVGILLLWKTFFLGWPSFVLAALAAFSIMKVGSALHFFYLQRRIYKGDLREFIIDTDGAINHFQGLLTGAPQTEKAPTDPGKLNLAAIQPFFVVAGPEKPLGKFMDANIYEWLHFVGGDGVVRRFTYHSVAQTPAQRINLPEGCIIVPPGIIYKMDDELPIVIRQVDETV